MSQIKYRLRGNLQAFSFKLLDHWYEANLDLLAWQAVAISIAVTKVKNESAFSKGEGTDSKQIEVDNEAFRCLYAKNFPCLENYIGKFF